MLETGWMGCGPDDTSHRQACGMFSYLFIFPFILLLLNP